MVKAKKFTVIERLELAIYEIQGLITLLEAHPNEFDFHQLWHCKNELYLAGQIAEQLHGTNPENDP